MPTTLPSYRHRWSVLLALLLTVTALSCAGNPEGSETPGRAIQPDVTFNASEDAVLTVAAENGVLVQIEEADPDTWAVTSTGVLTSDEEGSVEMQSDGSFVYTPAEDFEGPDYLTINVASDTGGEGDYIILFEVAGSNDPPTANNDETTTDEDAAVTISPLGNDTELDLNDSIRLVSVTQPGNGEVTADDDTGEVTYTPAADYFGEDSFTYVITDTAGEESSATVTVTVAPVNDAPVAIADNYGGNEDQAITVAAATGVLSNDEDVDDAQADLAATAGTLTTAQGGSVEMQANGGFTYTPVPNFNGSDSFTYALTDAAGASAQGTVSLTVDSVNDAPTAVNDSYSSEEDTTLGIAAAQGLLINDSDIDNDDLEVVTETVATVQGGSATLGADGGFSYTPANDFFGSDSFEYTVKDGRGGLTPATVSLSVSGLPDPPVGVDDLNIQVEEDEAAVIDVLANDFDVDGDSLTISSAENGDFGRVTINSGRRTITYTPDDDFEGTDSFSYRVSDGDREDRATVTVTVNSVNDPPTAVDDTAATQEETPVAINVVDNDVDLDQGENLTVQSVDTVGANGSVAINPNNRSVTYTPNDDFVGTDRFTYVVQDRDGATDTATVTVTVTNVAPVASNDTLGTISIGGFVQINVMDNDSDGEQLIPWNGSSGTRVTQVTYGTDSFTIPTNLNDVTITVICGTVLFSADGEMSLNRTGFFGCPLSDSLTYSIADSVGATSANATVLWGYSIFSDDATTLSSSPGYQTDEDLSLSVNANNGVLSAAGSVWSVNSTGTVETLFGGSATVNGNGGFSYTPPPNFSGSDSFGFSATGNNPPAAGRAVVTVDPVNDAPLAQADRYAVAAGGILDVPAGPGLLQNDIDLEGSSLTVSAVDDSGLSGTLTVQANGAFTYQAPLGAAGSESFSYTVSGGGSQSADVTLVYDAVAVPFAAADSYTTAEDSTLTVGGSGVRGNDSGGTAASAGSTSRFGGSVSLSAGGGFSYTPPPNFTGTDSFTYQLSGSGQTVTGLVRITVTALADAPLAGDDFFTIGSDTPFTASAAGGLLANDNDPDGNALTVSTTGTQTTDQGGEVEIFGDGRISYAPPSGFSGTDRFDYTVGDGTGRFDAATVIITVTP